MPRRRRRSTRDLLVVGTGPRAASVYEDIQRHLERGLRVIGFADDGDVPFDPSIPQGMVHKFIDTPDLLREQAIDEVIIACPRWERRRLSMRPGLTYLWQISGRDSLGFAEWVKLDLEYIDGWSLPGDFKILARTVPAVLRGTGS